MGHDLPASAPALTAAQAVEIADTHYGMAVNARPLNSERDQNFLIEDLSGSRFVLKIANPAEGLAVVEAQNAALQHLAANGPELPIPRLLSGLDGRTIIRFGAEPAYAVRLLTYLPGELWVHYLPHRAELQKEIGRLLGSFDRALLFFDHPALHRQLSWDLAHAGWIEAVLPQVNDLQRRKILERELARYQQGILPILPSLRRSIIHNDANDHNLLIDGSPAVISGLLDFGDMVYTQTIHELAIACAYVMLGQPDPLAAASAVVLGYHQALPLEQAEVDLLYGLIRMRLSVSAANAAYQGAQEHPDPYQRVSEGPVWRLLEQLEKIDPGLARARLRHAAGFTATPSSRALRTWLAKPEQAFSALVDPSLAPARLVLDLSAASAALESPDDLLDPQRSQRQRAGQLQQAGAEMGLGRYLEARPFADRWAPTMEGNQGPEWPSLHLGLDLFLPPGSVVHAPLEGIVHRWIEDAGGETGTLVLRHQFAKNAGFYSLYRNLVNPPQQRLPPAAAVQPGDPLGSVGKADDQAALRPHLHFQLVAEGCLAPEGVPPTCRPSEAEFWSEVCPDPNLILGFPEISPASAEPVEALLARRRSAIGPNLSLSYQRPLQIVRGWGQVLYDAEGQRYLDCVNNVAHVGHNHPRVVAAGRAQMGVLNTNTRYLHRSLLDYAERLTGTLPDPLRVCYLVCSGSEANELALRLARAHTGRQAMIVVDAAYHGNTSQLVAISPYKFNGPGGSGASSGVGVVPLPDTYRGPYRGPDAGDRYAAHVAEQAQSLAQIGLAGFICESLPGVAGQIVLPPGYLQAAYQHVRRSGGVCIADEVQVGMGRVGTHFWGFQTQDVVPDIVTIGKPIGNGHPMAAVVTTPEIAAAFDNGMEYFNTFGGNPVSSAIGMAVLDVIEQERLQQHAAGLGERLLAELRRLQTQFPLLGDVRGMGLFLGVELVRSPETQEPAVEEASMIVERLKEKRILISVDGAHHNVLKFKPPMVFNEEDAAELISALEEVLSTTRLKRPT